MVQFVLIGVGAGAAAALLFVSVASGSLISLALFQLAALPILVAGIGWSHWAGLLAAIVSGIGIAVTVNFALFTSYLLGVGLPAWWLGYLAMLARPGATPGMLEWYPPGMLAMWGGLLSALSVALMIPHFGLDQASFEAGLRQAFERALRASVGLSEDAPLAVPGIADPSRMLDLMARIAPPLAAAVGALTHYFNLWLAGRILQVSGRLHRPWPDVPSMRFPAPAAGFTVLALAASFAPGIVGTTGEIFLVAMLIAAIATGLAVLHGLSRGMNGRPVALATTYLTLLASPFLFGLPLLLAALVGLADSAFDFRGRGSRRGPPTVST
jgi:hypothetical protein